MERLVLEATTRAVGKGVARKIRAAGNIPAVLYGRKNEPVALSVHGRAFEKVTKASPDLTAIIDLTIDGKEKFSALIRDYQADVIRRHFTHLDFQAIDLTEKLDLEVPVHLIGLPIGVKDEGGVLEQLRRKIHIRVLPTNIPKHIEVDVSNLKIGQSVHADEVKLPEGVEFPHVTNYTIAAVVAPQKEEVAAAPVAAVEGAAATPAEGAAPSAEAEKGAKAGGEKAEKKG
ncbi:MAG: hypothetical protein A3I05_03815 [Deltaproteobacteria bacterium RIFCSPLOWO2_02_FULL_44_10]|nr:MAG: hypothetical protein A3C46_07925 [Deltaproteobacteria bacterium RIFCSPHIGHO2_02_FULL_44_16]OGQ47090.1 MAG: hypothetical protein A3I05_03815 [Deltaproteobacteria bacterium RIFCSPLOWO2_02_FULL_44_10]